MPQTIATTIRPFRPADLVVFNERLGFDRDGVVSLGKRLETD